MKREKSRTPQFTRRNIDEDMKDSSFDSEGMLDLDLATNLVMANNYTSQGELLNG